MKHIPHFRRTAVTSALARRYHWSRWTAARNVVGLEARVVGQTTFLSARGIQLRFGDDFLQFLQQSSDAVDLEVTTAGRAP
jgi:hypothetical protein